MDDLDRALIAHLKQDGRASVTNIAGHLAISRATVADRIDRLQQRGIIKRFTVELSEGHVEEVIRSVMMIEVAANRETAVTRALQRMPEIVQLHTTNGSWALVAHLETRTLAQFDQTLRKIQHIPGVQNSETCLLLDRAKG